MGVPAVFKTGITSYDMTQGEYYLVLNNSNFSINVFAMVTQSGENITIKTNMSANSSFLYYAEQNTHYIKINSPQTITNAVSIYKQSALRTQIQALFDRVQVAEFKVVDYSDVVSRLSEGEFGYNRSTNEIYLKGSGSSYTVIPLSKNAIYKYDNCYWKFNGTTLVKELDINLIKNVDDEINGNPIHISASGNTVCTMTVGNTYILTNSGDNIVNMYARVSEDSENIVIALGVIAGQIIEYSPTIDTTIFRCGGTNISIEISTKEAIIKRLDSLERENIKKKNVITLSYIAGGNIVAHLALGEYGYNTVTKKIYYKDTNSTYQELMPPTESLFLYQTRYYRWNGSDLITSHFTVYEPQTTFEIDYKFKDIQEEYNSFDLTTEGRNLVLEQVYAKFDALALAYPELITKYDPMATSRVPATEQSPAIEVLTDVLDTMTTAGYSDYPFYANGINSAGERTFTYPNGQTITMNYDVTPAYKTFIYRINYNNVAVNRDKAKKMKMLLTGGVHPNERMQPFNLYIFAKEICEVEDINLFKLASIYDMWIIPCVGGYSMYHDTRYNANGVNLNRNFDSDWQATTYSPGAQDYSGPYAGSEFETQLLMACYQVISPEAVIDCHNYSALQGQFFTITKNIGLLNVAYQSLIDCSKTFIDELPEYFGTKIHLFVENLNINGHAPMKLSEYKGAWDDWCHINGTLGAETVEVSQCINYYGGVLDEVHESWTLNVFKVAEYTLRTQVLKLAEWCMRHRQNIIVA